MFRDLMINFIGKFFRKFLFLIVLQLKLNVILGIYYFVDLYVKTTN